MTNILNLSFESGKRLFDGLDLNKMVKSINGLAPMASTLLSFPAASSVSIGTARFATDIGGGTEYISNGTSWNPVVIQSPYYFFHGYGGTQISGDKVFFDRSGNNNSGAFGANLSATTALGNTGYLTTTAPSSNDTSIHLPNLNFDFQGGQTLIFYWLGLGAAPGSTLPWAGDGFSNTAAGIIFRATTAGKVQLELTDGPGGHTAFSGTSTNATFDSTLHSFGCIIIGNNSFTSANTYSFWQDEVIDASNTNLTWSAVVNTINANNFNLGTSLSVSTSNGMAIQTRACIVLRLPSNKIPPSNATITNLFKQLRASPDMILNNYAF